MPPPGQVVNFAYLHSPAEAFPWVALQLRRLHNSVELWQASCRGTRGGEGCIGMGQTAWRGAGG